MGAAEDADASTCVMLPAINQIRPPIHWGRDNPKPLSLAPNSSNLATPLAFRCFADEYLINMLNKNDVCVLAQYGAYPTATPQGVQPQPMQMQPGYAAAPGMWALSTAAIRPSVCPFVCPIHLTQKRRILGLSYYYRTLNRKPRAGSPT